MSKNVVFMLSPWLLDGTLNSWKYWCNKYDVTLFNLKETITHDMPVSWQKYYLFDVLDHNKIDYNQVLIVDNNTIIHPECPNFFKKTDGKYCIVPDETNYNEIIKGMGFLIDKIFKKEDFPFYECGNTGFQIVNKNHKKLFGLMTPLPSMKRTFKPNKMNYKQNMTLWITQEKEKLNIQRLAIN